jgi:diguanylate cyclase (GGDEF)-like protein
MQVDLNNRNRNEGTGIGLSLVKQLVEFHKGKISLESEVNKGTSITLKFLKGYAHFPDEIIVDDQELENKKINYLNLIDFDYTKEKNEKRNQFYLSLESSKYDLGIFKDAVILIVEDNKGMRDFMFSLLGNITTVLMAEDGIEGLTLAKRYKPDLIISDVMMPKMNGYEFCNRVKNESDLQHSAVILLTAKTEVKMQIRGYESGADAYIGKPFNNNEFIAKIYSMLRIRSHQKHLAKENTSMIKENKKVKKINAKLLEINQELDKYSRTDVLTGLSNRRDFTEKINYELSRVHRSKKTFSILMCDIDYFKKVNDTYGHDCGDYVLIYIADLLRTTLREQDIIARWGGEEFIILLPDTSLKGAKEIAEKLRRRVAREQYVYNNKKFKLTVSIGISGYEEGHSIDDCIKIADESLYVAKETGRNKVLSLTSKLSN